MTHFFVRVLFRNHARVGFGFRLNCVACGPTSSPSGLLPSTTPRAANGTRDTTCQQTQPRKLKRGRSEIHRTIPPDQIVEVPDVRSCECKSDCWQSFLRFNPCRSEGSPNPTPSRANIQAVTMMVIRTLRAMPKA